VLLLAHTGIGSAVNTLRYRLVTHCAGSVEPGASRPFNIALSQYLWEVNHSVSSVVIGVTSFGFLFYMLIMMASILSFDCPFQTPVSLLIRFMINWALPYWGNLRWTLGPTGRPPQSGLLGALRYLPLPISAIGGGNELQPSIIPLARITPGAIQLPCSVTPLFVQRMEGEGDRLDARCINRMFVMSTDVDVVTLIMDFIPEIIWHGGIKNVPLERIYDILMDCFDFSGLSPVMIHKLRDVVYLSARAFAQIGLQRRCVTQYDEHEQDSWKALCTKHPLLSLVDYSPDSDLETALFVVDMTLGYGNGFPWAKTQMTPPHWAWMSHVFLYRAWHEGQVSEVVMDFVEHSMSIRPSDVVVTDCLFTIGSMVGIPLHVSDTTVRDKRWGSYLILNFDH